MRKLFFVLIMVLASHAMSSCSDYFTNHHAQKASATQHINDCCGDEGDLEDPDEN